MVYRDDFSYRSYLSVLQNLFDNVLITNTAQSVRINKQKHATVLGDKVTPTDWFHNTLVTRGSQSQTIWKWGRGPDYGPYDFYHQYVIDKQPCTPGFPATAAFNTGNIILQTSRIFHGDYAMSDKGALENAAQRKLSISKMVAELSETIVYFARYALDIAYFVKAVKRGRYEPALKRLGITKKAFTTGLPSTVSARFLEWKFAIRPVLSDIDDVRKEMLNQLKDLDLYYVTGQGKEKERVRTKSGDTELWGTDTGSTWVRRTSADYKRTMRTKFYAHIDDMELIKAQAVGLDAFAPAIWEIVPFSWLVDYVFDIGTVLETYSVSRGLSFINGYRSTRTTGSATDYRYWSNYSGVKPTVYPGVPSQCMQQLFTDFVAINGYNRSVMTTFPLPRVSFRLPDLSGGHLANVIALCLSVSKSSKHL